MTKDSSQAGARLVVPRERAGQQAGQPAVFLDARGKPLAPPRPQTVPIQDVAVMLVQQLAEAPRWCFEEELQAIHDHLAAHPRDRETHDTPGHRRMLRILKIVAGWQRQAAELADEARRQDGSGEAEGPSPAREAPGAPGRDGVAAPRNSPQKPE